MCRCLTLSNYFLILIFILIQLWSQAKWRKPWSDPCLGSTRTEHQLTKEAGKQEKEVKYRKHNRKRHQNIKTGNKEQHNITVTLMGPLLVSEFSLWDKFDQRCNNWPTRLRLQTPECSALVHKCWQDVHRRIFLFQKKKSMFYLFCWGLLFIQMSVLNVCNTTLFIYSVKLC